MKVIPAIRLIFLLCLILISIGVSGQNDTTIYFSKTLKVITYKINADYYSEFMKLSEGTFALIDYEIKDHKWIEAKKTIVKRETDSSFKLTWKEDNPLGSKDIVRRRFFNKTDSGYRI